MKAPSVRSCCCYCAVVVVVFAVVAVVVVAVVLVVVVAAVNVPCKATVIHSESHTTRTQWSVRKQRIAL